MTSLADRIPSGNVGVFIFCDILREGMKREVGGGKCEVGERWGVRVVGFVFLEKFDSAVGKFGSAIKTSSAFNGGKFLIVKVMSGGAEESTLILEIVGPVEAGCDRFTVEVPLADVVRAVACFLQEGRGKGSPRRAFSTHPAAFSF